MTKAELFKKYSINESHSKWENGIDNWTSVELYRVMHDGNLPRNNDRSVDYITEFLDKCNNTDYKIRLMSRRKDFGSLYLTAKRMVYSFSEQILKDLTNPTPNE